MVAPEPPNNRGDSNFFRECIIVGTVGEPLGPACILGARGHVSRRRCLFDIPGAHILVRHAAVEHLGWQNHTAGGPL